MPSSSRSHRVPSRPARPSRAKRPTQPVHPGPLHDQQHILQEHSNPATPLLAKHSDNPKSSVNNLAAQILGGVPQYNSVQGTLDGRQIWRQVYLSFNFLNLVSYQSPERLSL
jgi:hypothetical protein